MYAIRSYYGVVRPLSITVTVQEGCGMSQFEMEAATPDGDGVEFSRDGGSTIYYADNTVPYRLVYPTVPGEDSIQFWVRAVNSVTGCVGNWMDIYAVNHPIPAVGEIQVQDPAQNYLEVICKGDERVYTMNPLNGITHIWKVPALGIEDQQGDVMTMDWNVQQGIYSIYVWASDAFGCQSTVREEAVFVSAPDIDLGADVDLCEGESHTSYNFV